ncbi:uncharacterized protein LOC107658183 isoform X1 [Sinocyclocheilus anshuiensis]|uniref:uncharacterized protein LOC107658183 isoform X1 n=1 Tax=Sinocyclocheilus anshuiensis TaxID=1608454 RepID=UPI0007BA65FA|nr:PREDICTED: uncharacterized protein LOC107658183 isoform X1 [Sinocyclocheilus anshuiensis]
MAGTTTHITIQKGQKFPQLERCTKCCHKFHCPFCMASIFKPCRPDKVKLHLKSHRNKAVVHGDFTIHRCGLGCRASLHYHCMYCPTTILRRGDFKNHLQVCKHNPNSESVTKMLSSTSTPVTALTVINTPSIIDTAQADPSVNYTPSTTSTDMTALTITDSPSTTATGKFRTRPVIKKRCPSCNVLINKNNLLKHMERRHADQSELDIGETFQLTSQCVDETNGIFAVLKVVKGHGVPLHVQFQTLGENNRVLCESNECQINIDVAQRSGITSYQCMHISAASFCKSVVEQVSLEEDVLTEMVRGKWFSVKKKKECLALQQLANSSCVPLSVHTSIGISSAKKFISVFEPNVTSYSRLGRVMVVYNTELDSWHCPCTKLRRSCLHKYVAKWHLFQTQRELFRTDGSPYKPHSEEEDIADNSHVYPPKGLGLEYIVNYILQNKKIPAVLPEDMRVPSPLNDYPQNLCPNETVCQECPGDVLLSDPMLVTQNAKILTNWCIIKDVATYCKQCPQCGMFYRYQEWKDRLHNFNDHIILDISLCLTLRNLLQVHTSVSRAVEFLQLTTGVEFPPPETMLHAYLQFEALTDHEYKYSCPTCGDHPPVVIMGVHKQTASPLSENDIEKPPGNFKGEVNLEEFWESLSKEMISRGFVANGRHNPFAVPPSYHFWAPWIGKNTRHSDTVLNTEFEKVHSSKSASEILKMTLTEERLREELFKQKDDVIRSLCNECGVDSTGSRSDLLLRLSGEMKSRQTYDKIYSKIWSATGGWGVIMCPCGIVYSLKCNLRAESHQDFADLLLSWHHMPNVIIYDFAQALSKHTNLRAPEKLPISPFEGRLVEPTQDNTELAKCGQLKVSLPWLDEKTRGTESDPHGHPVTGSSDHYVLCDRFHEGSTEDGDVLRKLTLVPQLADKVSSEIAEQLFAQMKKNDYFLNMSLPSTHLFQMRNIIHHYNENKANKLSTRSTKSFGSNLLTEAVLGKL